MNLKSKDPGENGFFNRDTTKRWIKILLLLALGSHLMYLTIRKMNSYPSGDGPEYVMMTEALYNHLSPEIRYSDYDSFKKTTSSFVAWEQFHKFDVFDQIGSFLSHPDLSFKDGFNGLFISHNGKAYFYHFSLYSLFNVPVRAIADINHFPPLRSFQVTNALLIIITCFFLLFYSPFKIWQTVFITLSFVFSSVYWYLGWTSPEVFTICFVTLAFWFYFQGKRYIPILLLSLATMQNQPIVILAAFISLAVLLEQGITIKNILKLFAANILVIVPPLFYLYHFDTSNLIKELGFLSWDVVTLNRVWGFYTDLNQGMILAIPLLLIIYPFLWIREVLHSFKLKKFKYDLLLPFFLLAMVCVFCTMINWNHGMAVINRYATWSSAVLMIHAFAMMHRMGALRQLVLILICFVTQLISVLYNNKYYNHYDWDQELTKPWAKWMYENLPAFYNPDPVIFFVRTTRNYSFSPEKSPALYINKNGEMCKTLVHHDFMSKLADWGIPSKQIDSLTNTRKFVNGWAYFNKGELNFSVSRDSLLLLKREERIQALIFKIQTNENWFKSIEQKAKDFNISTEEMLRADAIYLYNQESN
jgi:hypothetical protein